MKLGDDKYVEWGSAVDAPISYVVDRETAVKAASPWNLNEDGVHRDLVVGEERIARADETGTSAIDVDVPVEEFIRGNRAGRNETELSLEEIIKQYSQCPMDDET